MQGGPASSNAEELREKIGDRIVQAGGEWEVVMGGLVFVHILRESDFDLDQLFRELKHFPAEIVDGEK